MGEVNDIDLKLNILANDEASTVLKDLSTVTDALKVSLDGLNGINPFAEMQASATDLLATMREMDTLLGGIGATVASVNSNDEFSTMAMQIEDAVLQGHAFEQVLSNIRTTMTSEGSLFTPWETGLKDVSTAVIDISGEIIDIRDEAETISFAKWSEPLPALLSDLTRADQQLMTIKDTANQVAIALSSMDTASMGGVLGGGVSGGSGGGSGKSVPGWLGAIRGANSMLSELPMKMLYGGMNAMMGYYGLQSLATGGNNFAAIQQMMNLNNSTVNQAAQYQEMLGATGMTGTSGVQFLQGLANNLHSAFFTMNGALSSTGMQLTQYGITKQDLAESPMQLLNTIGVQYRSLVGQGRGSEAANLLGLTGTTQVAGLLQNWDAMQKQTSSTNLGMSPQQLQKAVQSNVSLQVSLQQLSLAFDQMAISLVPLVDKLSGALTGVVNAFTHGKGPISDTMNAIGVLQKHLGDLGLAVVGAIATIKAASTISDVLSGMGVIGEVGGGMTLGKLAGKGIKGVGRLFGMGGGAAAGETVATAAEGGASGAAGLSSLGWMSLPIAVAAGLAPGKTQTQQMQQTLHNGNYTSVSQLRFGTSPENLGGNMFSSGFWQPVVNGFKHLTSWANTTGSHLSDWANTHQQQIDTWAQTTGQHISNWTSTHASDLLNWATTTGNRISSWSSMHMQDLDNWAMTTGGKISSWTSTHTQDFISWAARTGTEIGSWVVQHTNDIGIWARTTGQQIGSWVAQHTSDIGTWAQTTGQHIGTWVSTHTKDLEGWAKNTGKSIGGWVTNHTKDLVSWVDTTGTKIGDWASTHTSDLLTWVSQTGGGLSSWFSQTMSGFDHWASSTSNSLFGWFSQAEQVIFGWVQKLAGIFGININTQDMANAGSWMTNAVKNLGNTIGGWFSGGSSSVPSGLGSSNQSFVHTVMPYAQQVSTATGLPLAGIIGQWAYESGWGQSTAAQQNANLAGIMPFGQYGTGKDAPYAGFSNLAQFAQADISVLNESRYSGARALAKSGGSISSIYALLSQEGYDTSNPGTYGSGVQSLAQSIATMIPHMANGGVVGSPTLAVIGEAGPEAVVPLRGGGMSMGGMGGGNVTIQVNVNGPTLTDRAQARQIAQVVASELVSQVKRRGNFDWG